MKNDKTKGRILSGMRPTGKLHLGNLFGALDNWVKLQDDYETFFMVADWHALTTEYENPKNIDENSVQVVIDWLSSGISPEKSTIFRQSDVKEHSELYLLLSLITPLSWLERCPTYKEQVTQLSEKDIMTHGFLGYPVLQAADILIYKADTVPVGNDQLPHLELCREIARRFNYLYDGQVFPEPQAKLNNITLLPGIDGRKMSKSYGNVIELSASPDKIKEIVQGMVTDPNRARRKDPGNPDVCPVFSFHKAFNIPDDKKETITTGCRTAGIGCVDCKKWLTESMSEHLIDIYKKRKELEANPDYIEQVLEQGAEKARITASETMKQVRACLNTH